MTTDKPLKKCASLKQVFLLAPVSNLFKKTVQSVGILIKFRKQVAYKNVNFAHLLAHNNKFGRYIDKDWFAKRIGINNRFLPELICFGKLYRYLVFTLKYFHVEMDRMSMMALEV